MTPAQQSQELSRQLARAMLMADLLTHRLSLAYVAENEHGEELSYAVEEEGRELIRVLDAAQDIVLEHRVPAA